MLLVLEAPPSPPPPPPAAPPRSWRKPSAAPPPPPPLNDDQKIFIFCSTLHPIVQIVHVSHHNFLHLSETSSHCYFEPSYLLVREPIRPITAAISIPPAALSLSPEEPSEGFLSIPMIPSISSGAKPLVSAC